MRENSLEFVHCFYAKNFRISIIELVDIIQATQNTQKYSFWTEVHGW